MNDKPDRTFVLGVDVGGTKTAVCRATADGRIDQRREFATTGPDETLVAVVNAARALGSDYTGIGISCGGPLDAHRGIIQSPPNLPGWDEVPITGYLSDRLGVPAWLENDANAGALAEWRYGAGRGVRSLVFLTCGTGMGAGLILDGRLYRGTTGMAGEVGHIRLADDGPVGYHKPGSFEGFCSGGGIAKLTAAAMTKPHPASELDRIARETITAKHVAEAAGRDDALACSIITESGRRLGQALAILVDVLNIEMIVLGALGWRLGSLWLDPAMAVLEAEALPQSVQACRVVPAELGESIGDHAALAVAVNGLQNQHA